MRTILIIFFLQISIFVFARRQAEGPGPKLPVLTDGSALKLLFIVPDTVFIYKELEAVRDTMFADLVCFVTINHKLGASPKPDSTSARYHITAFPCKEMEYQFLYGKGAGGYLTRYCQKQLLQMANGLQNRKLEIEEMKTPEGSFTLKQIAEEKKVHLVVGIAAAAMFRMDGIYGFKILTQLYDHRTGEEFTLKTELKEPGLSIYSAKPPAFAKLYENTALQWAGAVFDKIKKRK
ncbi:MAG: hypothetical protein ACTHMC_13335 [Pseudobacter sp.]|uniref:hypothetical protein n=1 Tax=Pseudobacter sp. TaxID=2045420 RepID=UPI003F812990